MFEQPQSNLKVCFATLSVKHCRSWLSKSASRRATQSNYRAKYLDTDMWKRPSSSFNNYSNYLSHIGGVLAAGPAFKSQRVYCHLHSLETFPSLYNEILFLQSTQMPNNGRRI